MKKDYSYGYYTQIQMVMSLSDVDFCDFVIVPTKI